jgi:hypothetical protein
MTIVTNRPTQVAETSVPVSGVDPYSDEVLIEPWQAYRELRDLGAAVWLTRYQMFALTRYDSEVKASRRQRVLVGIRRHDEQRYESDASSQHALQRRHRPSMSASHHREAIDRDGFGFANVRDRCKAPAISKRPISLCSLVAATAVALTSGIVHADEPKPIQAQRLDLGGVAGIAYYTIEPDGFHVVATLAQHGKDGVPLRVQSVLNAGQRLEFSTPGVIGVEPATITLERQGEKLVVRSNRQ